MAQAARFVSSSRVEARRAATVRAILDGAWQLSARSGLESLSLRELAACVGMQAPSLYSYFPSKAAILDALFADGNHRLSDVLLSVHETLPANSSPRRRLVELLSAWIGFCQADPARYQLMFTMAVPGWQPSETAYATSLDNYQRLCDHLALAGVTDPDDVDLCTALSAGLVAQQMSNDLHGDRWSRRVAEVVDMFLLHTATRDRRAARLAKGKS